MGKMRRSAVALSAIMTVAACGDAEMDGTAAGDGWAGEIVDSAGITVVRNPSSGLWEGSGAWTVAEEMRIGGGFDVSEDYQFGLVAAISVDAAGNVWVADQQAATVRKYSPEGEYLATAGRPGGGPGEIGLQLAGVFATSEGIEVPDLGNFRVSLFGDDGEFISSRGLNIADGIPIRWDQHPDGRIVAQYRSAGQAGNDLEGGDKVRTFEEEPVTLLELPKGESFSMSSETGVPQFRIFEPEPIWDLGEDGRLAYGMNNDYRIQLYNDAGEVSRIVTFPFEQRPVTEGDQSRMRRAFGRLLETQGVPPAALDAFLAGVQFGETYPAFAQIILAQDGGIWVQLLRTADEMGADEELNLQDLGSNRWDVFDPEGRYLGEMTMPEKFQPVLFRGDAIYGIQRDEFDVQSVVRFRVNRG